ncbi:LLM class flavin-dependent oxidoreductase [Candidatus Thorarchaeota archaeon]|nr:MAG: LLM class flavin-dependent oxidoreductase [Candidatus Thorarchaeota archaeon]
MEWSVALNVVEPVAVTVRNAVRLEKAGFSSLWITDFPAIRSAAPLAAAVAANTDSCRIGIGLLSPDLYGVNQITRQVSTLVTNFGDRFDVLIGPGDARALNKIGVRPRRGGKQVDRVVEAAQRIGRNLQSLGQKSRVFLGAQGPKMIEASSELDGVLLNYSDQEMIEWAINRLKARRDGFVIGAFPPTCMDLGQDFDSHFPIRRAAAMVAFGMARSARRNFQLDEDLHDAQLALERTGRLNEDVIGLIDPEVLRRFAICKNKTQLCDYLHELKGIGVDLVVLGPPLCTSEDGIEAAMETKKSCDP